MPKTRGTIFAGTVLAILATHHLAAAPMITFERLPGNTTGSIVDWPDLKKITFTTTNTGAIGPLFFFNASGNTYLDFHFTFGEQGAEATGDGGPFFKQVTGTKTSLDFARDTGTGIRSKSSPDKEVFKITGSGFGANIQVEAQPTVPEPSSIILIGLGLIVLSRIRRSRA